VSSFSPISRSTALGQVAEPVVVGDRLLHLVGVDVVGVQRDLGRAVAQLGGGGVHVLELLQGGSPVPVPLSPVQAGGEPDREGLGEVLVRVLLCVPARDVGDVGPGEGLRLEVLLVRLVVVAEQRSPGGSLVQPVGVVEAVPRLVAEVHEDLPLRLHAASQLALDRLKRRVGEVERNADDRDPGRAPPLVAQVALRAQVEAPGAELLVELVDEPVEVRPRQLEAEVLDAGAEEGLALRAQRGLSAVTRVRLLALMKGGGPAGVAAGCGRSRASGGVRSCGAGVTDWVGGSC
jgi:hypothetical protein